MTPASIYPIHDLALTVEFPLPVGMEAHEKVMQLQQLLWQFPLKGLTETVPAYNSIAIYLNDQSNWMEAKKELEKLLGESWSRQNKSFAKDDRDGNEQVENLDQKNTTAPVTIPVCYDVSLGFDQEIVCRELKVSPKELIQLHSQIVYTVFMIGFVPGFPYMGELDDKLVMPRKKTPLAKVPAGSVAIAGKQTGIYPFEVPGGWQIIGRTPLILFDKRRDPYCLLQPGMNVKFEPIDLPTFQNWK